MNQELMNKFATWLQGVASKIETLAVEQVPPLVTEFLQWRLYSNVFDAAINLLLMTASALVIFCAYKINLKCYHKWKSEYDGINRVSYFDSNDSFLPTIFGVVASIVAAVFFCINTICMCTPLKEIIHISVAPKIYLIEEAAKLIK